MRSLSSASDLSPDMSPDMSRRRALLAGLGLPGVAHLVGCATARPAQQVQQVPQAGGIPLFSASPAGAELPPGWRAHVMRRDLPPTRYALCERDGRVAVHARAEASTSGLRCDVDIDPLRQPWLDWQWRVDEVPTRATVADDDLDDAPARVVLAFDGDLGRLSLRDQMFHEQVELFTGHTLPFATLMYTWDGQAPVGSVFQYPRSSRIRYLVVDSGTARAGQWVRQRRNLLEDYRQVFGGTPGRLRHIGILTDSDDLGGLSEAWFGDLRSSA